MKKIISFRLKIVNVTAVKNLCMLHGRVFVMENSSSRTLHSICGSLLKELSLIFDGRLSTLLKCPVHLSKKACLSFRTALCPCGL